MSDNNHNNTDRRPYDEWKTVHEIKGGDGMRTRIQRRGDRRPQYSLQLGRERRQEPSEPPNERLLPFVPVFIRPDGAVNREAIQLVEAALAWVQEDVAVHTAAATYAAASERGPSTLPTQPTGRPRPKSNRRSRDDE